MTGEGAFPEPGSEMDRPGETAQRLGPTESDAGYRVEAGPTLLALALSLAGFLLIAAQLYSLRFQGAGPTFAGFPSRLVFVFALTLVVAPLILAVFRRPPLLVVLPPIALVFLLYPLFSPYGIPSGQDGIYNFQFALSLLGSGHWVPGSGVTLQAVAYSYYPASGVFNAELAMFTGVPLYQTFLWGEPLLRLLVLPPLVYGLARRYFGPRVGLVSVLILLATPSILFNYPVESEFAIPFFALALLLLSYLLAEGLDRPGVVLGLAVVFAAFVVVSHHFSSYVLVAWLGVLLVLWAFFRPYASPHRSRAAVVAGAYLVAFLVFTAGVSRPNFIQNYQSLQYVVHEFLNPASLSTSTATSIGSSFPEYMLVWSYLAYAGLLLVSLLVLRRWLRARQHPFMTANLTVSVLLVLVAVPLLVTAFAFLAQRVMEYGAIFMAPAVAWWVTQRVATPTSAPVPGPAPAPKQAPGWPPPRSASRHRLAWTVGTVALVLLLFTGASLVPFSTRDQFAPTSAITTESPLHVDRNTYTLALWAHTHLTSSSAVWGDMLTLCVFGGFGRFEMAYDQYLLFNGTTIPLSVWSLVSVGSYVVVDKYMTTSTPQFPGPSNVQPTAPLTAGQLAKFNDPAYFELVYQDSTFTIYQVAAVP